MKLLFQILSMTTQGAHMNKALVVSVPFIFVAHVNYHFSNLKLGLSCFSFICVRSLFKRKKFIFYKFVWQQNGRKVTSHINHVVIVWVCIRVSGSSNVVTERENFINKNVENKTLYTVSENWNLPCCNNISIFTLRFLVF